MKTVKMTKKEFEKEHEKLVPILERAKTKEAKKEAVKQKKELIAEKMKK